MSAHPTPPTANARFPATRLLAAWLTCALVGVACGGDSTGGGAGAGSPPPSGGSLRVTRLTTGLASPWGLAFLPDGRMLVTEKAGRIRRLSADGRTIESSLGGVPTVDARGQGGLLDVAVDPDFAASPWIYFTYAEPGTGSEAGKSGTALARARLAGDTLQDVQVIYRQVPKVSGSGHYGSRIAFGRDGTLYVSLGERQLGAPAQDVATSLGKVVRLKRDGTVPADNPALGDGARPEVWSLGHRNPQGIAIHPSTGDLWVTEHGPQGGDELNLVQKGGNHGWPAVSYGCPYGSPVGDGCRIGGGTHAPRFIEPVATWVPTSTAPSSLLFYSGAGFPQWAGNAFVGALAGRTLWRVVLDGNREVARDEPLAGKLSARVRQVKQGPDGWLYLLSDDGELLRVER